ncbi:hypothetical protein L226DRAFT_545767 [Lentinus tigrinus ALCF2SS1-7]|nr:hypothetical protein L226DRAFT_545767 [Lentinus tigrinus ALCF2SS1-7]
MSMANTPVLVISRPMPQQPMPPLRRAKQPKQLRSPDRRKRYGMVFNTDPLQGMLEEEDDDDSTWSMSRSRSSRRMLGSRHTSVRTRNSSPAQEIAARYRASHSEDLNASSSSVSYLQVPSGYTSASRSRTTSGETSISSTSGPRLRYRDSRAHAMDHSTKEAYVMAVRCGSYLNIPCQRPGCRDILPDIRNLASHLAIHDLEPQASRDRYVRAPRHSSFVDMGHSVDGRSRRHYMRSPAPYARSHRSYSKFRRYLWKLTSCVPCYAPDDDNDDFL